MKLRPIVDRVLDLIGREPRTVLEVGSFLGTSIVHGWANFIGKGKDGILLSIDTWEGAGFLRMSPDYRPHMNLQHGMPQTYKYFMTNVVKHGLTEKIFPLTLPSLVGARILGYLNWKVDVVYLDSAHEAGETYIELQLYFDLLEPGGILFGDDYDSYPAVRHHVDRFASCSGLEVVTFPNTFLLQKPLQYDE